MKGLRRCGLFPVINFSYLYVILIQPSSTYPGRARPALAEVSLPVLDGTDELRGGGTRQKTPRRPLALPGLCSTEGLLFFSFPLVYFVLLVPLGFLLVPFRPLDSSFASLTIPTITPFAFYSNFPTTKTLTSLIIIRDF